MQISRGIAQVWFYFEREDGGGDVGVGWGESYGEEG